MKNLDKETKDQYDALVGNVEETFTALERVAEEYNDLMEDRFKSFVKPRIKAYSDAVKEVHGFFEWLKKAQADHFESKSEFWQNSEAGHRYLNWMRECEGFEDRLVPFRTPLSPPRPIKINSLDIGELEDIPT